jgi:hypothetical protein
VEWNWQVKTKELEEKPVPVPLCPPQIPHGLTRDRTRASAVGGRRLTAWAMARPYYVVTTAVDRVHIAICWRTVRCVRLWQVTPWWLRRLA